MDNRDGLGVLGFCMLAPNENGAPKRPVEMRDRAGSYFANSISVMQSSVTVMAVLPEFTCTAILSMLVTCAAVTLVPGAAVSQQVAEKLVKGIAVPEVSEAVLRALAHRP